MTGQDLYDFFSTLVDDSDLDIDNFLVLVNVAKDRREDVRPWQYLKKLDSSKTASVGDTYLTAKALPTDWRYDYKLYIGTEIEAKPVPFEQQHIFKNSPNYYFVDVASGNYYLTGSQNSSKTIYNFYIKTTADITASTSWSAPSRFHPLLAFDVAGFFMNGIDADDIYRGMAPEQKAAALLLDHSMIAWDTSLKMRSMNNSFAGGPEDTSVPLGMM